LVPAGSGRFQPGHKLWLRALLKTGRRVRLDQAAHNAFGRQRSDAKRRGIPFKLSFEEWWSIWKASGHWHERGRSRGQFVMARNADQGAYEVGNVKIITCEENSSEIRGERQGNAKLTEEKVLAIRSMWRTGGVTQRQIAAHFGISFPNVNDIVLRKTWRHVRPPRVRQIDPPLTWTTPTVTLYRVLLRKEAA
jgi:hypothetical protein